MNLSWIGTITLVCVVGAAMFAGCSDAKPSIAFANSCFYGPDGKFSEDKAKDAYIAVMKFHGYPVYPDIRKNLYVTDYGLGKFTEVGLGCVMWVNNEKDHYMLMDIYLLPNQMLPEHWHVAGQPNPAKLEGWLIRYGLSHVVGEGEANLGKDVKIPKIHMGGTTSVQHEVAAGPGVFVPLNREGAHHWQLAGPEGAIISEVANVHTGKAVRHADKTMNENFLKGQ
jgi:D-lyxose ketol-isomerase